MPQRGLNSFDVTLRDGSSAHVRPVEAGDKEALQVGLQRLSSQSRYRRFMSPISGLSSSQLHYLTEIDYHDHMAWVALDLGPPQAGLGISRYVRIPDQPDVAEAAVTVVDSHHQRGLGTVLLQCLARSARQNGIAAFRGYVLEENEPMLRLLREMGAHMYPEAAGVLRVETPIPDDLDDLAETATSKVFRAVAGQVMPPLAVRFLHREISRVVKLFSHSVDDAPIKSALSPRGPKASL